MKMYSVKGGDIPSAEHNSFPAGDQASGRYCIIFQASPSCACTTRITRKEQTNYMTMNMYAEPPISKTLPKSWTLKSTLMQSPLNVSTAYIEWTI